MLIAREHFRIAFPLEIQIESRTRRDSDCDLRVDADIGQRPSVRFEDQRQVERVGFGEVDPGYPRSVIRTRAEEQRFVRGEQLAHRVLDLVVRSGPPAHA